MMEVFRSLIGLFIDDEFMAIAVLAVVASVALLVLGFGVDPLVAGALLLAGNVVVLVISALRTALRKGQSS
jgi:hypothetical protein